MSRAGSARASRRDFIFLGSAEHSARSSRHVAGALLCLRGKRFESREISCAKSCPATCRTERATYPRSPPSLVGCAVSAHLRRSTQNETHQKITQIYQGQEEAPRRRHQDPTIQSLDRGPRLGHSWPRRFRYTPDPQRPADYRIRRATDFMEGRDRYAADRSEEHEPHKVLRPGRRESD